MKKHCRIYNEPPPLSEDPTVAQYQKFLVKLQKHLEIYNNFINKTEHDKSLVSSSQTRASRFERLFMNSLIGLVACYNSLMLEMPEREWNAKFSLKNGTAGGN